MTAVAIAGVEWRNRNGRPVHAHLDRAGVLVFRPYIRDIRDFAAWASGKSQYLISKLLNQLFNQTAYTFPTPLYAALWTATLSASSTGSTAGEASYTGYARVSVTPNTTNFSTSAAGSATTNSTAITFAANGGTLQTATYVAILDASTTGNILYWGSITSTAVNPGDTPQINSSAMTVTEA